jgi:hypothetical protein
MFAICVAPFFILCWPHKISLEMMLLILMLLWKLKEDLVLPKCWVQFVCEAISLGLILLGVFLITGSISLLLL